MLLYHIPFLRKFLGGKWGKVTGLFFGHRWIHLSPDALEFTEYWSHGKLVPKLHCLDCYWSGLIDRAANGIWELQLGEPYYVRTFADGSVSKPGDPAKVCPVCGSPLYTYCEP